MEGDERLDVASSAAHSIKRRGFGKALLLSAGTVVLSSSRLVSAASAAVAPPAATAGAEERLGVLSQTITEYQLPSSKETHEIVKIPDSDLALISLMHECALIKIRLDPETERVTAIAEFPVATPDSMSMPHGLILSEAYRGLVWCTLEGSAAILFVDPGAADVQAPPRIVRRIDLPAPAKGPHHVYEYGDDLWISLKESNHVLRISHRDPANYAFYDAPDRPIFIACHPVTGDFYATCDLSGTILRITPNTGRTSVLYIPPTAGTIPVGLIGFTGGGTGTFGRIDAHGKLTFYRLKSDVGARAGLLHLAFDRSKEGQPTTLWLLSSSIYNPTGIDSIIQLTFTKDYSAIASERLRALPTQQCKAHRLLLLPKTVLVTEMASSTLAQLTRSP